MAVVTGNISVTWSFTQTKTAGFPGVAGTAIPTAFTLGTLQFANGATANKVQKHVWQSVSLAAAPTTFDLTAMADPFGTAVDFSSSSGGVRALYHANQSAVDGQDVTWGLGASNGWTNFLGGTTPTRLLKPGGVAIDVGPNTTGWLVTSVNKTYKLDPGANTITVEMAIEGY